MLRRSIRHLGAAALVVSYLLWPPVTGTASPSAASRVEVGEPWRGKPGITETVAEIMARGRRQERTRPRKVAEEHPPLRPTIEKSRGPVSRDAAPPGPRTSESAIPPTPGVSFLATTIGEAGSIPPDTMGSVGPSQILVHTNGRVKLFDKDGTADPALNVDDSVFWASVRNGVGVSDPHVEYDRLSERWFLTIINVPPSGANRVLVARSSGPVITNSSSFTFFQFQFDQVGTTPNIDTGRFADYPTLGVDKFALYIGVNVFTSLVGGFSNTTGYVVNKANLISGSLTVTAFRGLIGASTGPYTPQGVHNQDPGATNGYFIGVDAFDFDELVIRRVSNPGGVPSISGNLTVPVDPTWFPIFGVPQPNPGPDLDDLDDRPFAAMIARSPAGQLRLWTAHNIRVTSSGTAGPSGNRDGSRWYEIGNLDAAPAVVQSGTIFDPSMSQPHSFWIPSISASGQGHAVIGMSRAGANATTGHAGVAVAERLAGDPAGTFGSPTLVQSSTFLYETGFTDPERWGDYSQTVIDPNDNMTFWTFQEYVEGTDSWGVRVIELKAPPPADPSSVTPSIVPQCTSVDVEVTGTSSSGSGFFDPGPDPGGPGFADHIEAAVDGGVAVNMASFDDPTHVTVDLDTSSGAAGPNGITITNPDGQSDTTAGLLTVSGTDGTAPAAFNLSTPPDEEVVTSVPTFTWEASSDTGGCGLDKYQLWIDGMLNRDDISPSATSTTPVAPLGLGAHTWKIVAVDGASPPNQTQSTEEWDITVVNQAPVLNAIGNKTTAEGQQLSFAVSATDADGDTLTYSASNLPTGASFNAATHTFSWTPGFTQAGIYPGVHFEVTDGLDSATEEIQITVTEGTLGPKQVALKAKPKKVEKGDKVKLTATVSPCPGHEGDLVDLFRGSKKIGTKATNSDCAATFKVKMKKTARFQAVSPKQDDDHLEGTSGKVKVRVI